MNQTSDHSKLAGELFAQGYNCAQSVLLAFEDITGLDRETAARVASSFGGGIGGSGEVCGALTGALMALGLVVGNTDPADKAAKSFTAGAVSTSRFSLRRNRARCAARNCLLCRNRAGRD